MAEAERIEQQDPTQAKILRMAASDQFKQHLEKHAAMVRAGHMDRVLAGCSSLYERLHEATDNPTPTTEPDFEVRVNLCRRAGDNFMSQYTSGRFTSDPAEQLGYIAAMLTFLVAEDEMHAGMQMALVNARASSEGETG